MFTLGGRTVFASTSLEFARVESRWSSMSKLTRLGFRVEVGRGV